MSGKSNAQLLEECTAGNTASCEELRERLYLQNFLKRLWPIQWLPPSPIRWPPVPGLPPSPIHWPPGWPWPPGPDPDPEPWIGRELLFDELIAHMGGGQGEPNPQPSRPIAGIFDKGVQLEMLRSLHSQLGDAIKQMEAETSRSKR